MAMKEGKGQSNNFTRHKAVLAVYQMECWENGSERLPMMKSLIKMYSWLVLLTPLHS